MIDNRYFEREWEEEYYIFDSTEISEEKVDEEIEYGYEIFADALTGDEVINRLNEQEELIQELYDSRLIYNALLFNEWSKHDTIEVYKSKKHSDGELCFDGEWFVVVAILPTGQITNHYHIKYWDYFQIKEYPQVKDEFDGHNSSDILNRLQELIFGGDD